MTEGLDPGAPLPPYARRIDSPGGALRRACLHRLLRLTIRRMWRLDADVAAMRARQAIWDARFARVDPHVRRTPISAANFSAEWIDVPESTPTRVILYFHGGAFILRVPGAHTALLASWCRRLRARALMVDYRLAPENPYPAAPDDCHAAYRWLLGEGVAARDIVLGGDSAGGNLVLVTLQRIKAAGEPLPACGVAMSPAVDFSLSSRSLVANERRDPLFTLAAVVPLRGHYAPPKLHCDPGVSPLFGDFSNLPPLLFQVGSEEMLLDESTRAAARAHAAGVTVELEIWQHMAHVFQILPLPQARVALDHIAAFIARHAGWRA